MVTVDETQIERLKEAYLEFKARSDDDAYYGRMMGMHYALLVIGIPRDEIEAW